MGENLEFFSPEYWLMLGVVLLGRSMDLLSTWVASPRLVLEANPLARRLGWKWGLPVNVILCAGVAAWPLPAITLATASLMVAASNFQRAAIMRALGEAEYLRRAIEQTVVIPPRLFFLCLAGQTLLVAAVGVALVWWSADLLVPLGVGLGLIAYAVAVAVYSALSQWRRHRAAR